MLPRLLGGVALPTGIVVEPYKAFAMSGGAAVVTADLFADRQWSGLTAGPTYGEIAVALAPGADVTSVRESLLGVAADVVTKDEAAEQSIDSFTGGQQVFTVVIIVVPGDGEGRGTARDEGRGEHAE